MPTRVDHVIAAASDFTALEVAFHRLGFHVTGGGTHPHLGTRNRIVILGEGYLELLGIADREAASPIITQRLTRDGSGWVGFALQSGDIAEEAHAMRERGVDARGPLPGRLVSPSGTARSWRVVMRATDDLWASAEPLPFLIQHDTIGTAHQVELAGEGGMAPHANGALHIHDVTVAVRDLSAASSTYAQAYGLQSAGEPRWDAFLGAHVIELPLAEGDERIVLACPADEGIARQRIQAAGEGVCSVGIVVSSCSEAETYLRKSEIMYSSADGDIVIAPGATLGLPLRLVAER